MLPSTWSVHPSRQLSVEEQAIPPELKDLSSGSISSSWGAGRGLSVGGGPLGVPILEGNCHLVVVEVVYVVPGSIPERVQHANMDDWRMDCPWWIVLLYNAVSGLERFLLSRNHEYCYGAEGP